MKKVVKRLLAVLFATTLCSCKSKAERELERAQKELQEQEVRTEEAKKNYEKVSNTLEEYQKLKDQLDGNH